MQKYVGSLETIGGHCDPTWSNNITYINGVAEGDYSIAHEIADTTGVYIIEVTFRTPSTVSGGDGFYIQPNRGSWTAVETGITELTLTESELASGEVYSQMMIDAEGILFDTTGNLVLSAEHVIFDTVNPVVIPSAAIPNLSANKITTGTLNAANVNVINVNANNITGKNASLIQASFNDINSSVQVDGTGLTTVDVNGLYAKYASGAITFGGGGEVVRMKNNTGNNPNRSGVALEPINSEMSNIDLDLYTRGIASLNIGKSDHDDGYRLRISSELANTNNCYFSLKSGTAFSFNFDARNYTDSRNSIQILQHNSAHHSIGKNQNWGSQLHFVNNDLIVAKGGTDNRTNLFAGGLYGRGVYYQYGTSTYDIAGTITDILSWIGSGVTWRMKS